LKAVNGNFGTTLRVNVNHKHVNDTIGRTSHINVNCKQILYN